MLQRFLQGDAVEPLPAAGLIEAVEASTWGPVLVARHFFEQLGLWRLLDSCRRWPRLLPKEDPDDDWPSRVCALIANRLVRPVSEHALAGWLETDYVCDRDGRRYLPHWKAQGRVQVDLTVLQYWYRTLDHLILNQAKIELALYGRLRDLFNIQPDLVFYDLTSTYFEGHGPAGLAKHGYSRDGKPRNVQVVVGVVMVAGWPIGMRPIWHHNERRVRAHIFVAALSFLMERMLERALKDAGVPLSAQAALIALQTIRHVRFQVDGHDRTGVTPGSRRARQVLRALRITESRPPTPPEGTSTTV
jgi:hypothetical protein